MSELIIASVSGAGVTVTVAICVTLLGLRLSDAKERLADARVSDAKREAAIATAEANNKVLAARAELAEKRLRDADALISEMVRDLPVDGSFERLLRAYSRARSLDGAGGAAATEPVPNKPATSGTGSDDLLKPGDES